MLLSILLVFIVLVIIYNTLNKKIIEKFPYVYWVHKRPALRRLDKYHYGVPYIMHPYYYTNRYFYSPTFYFNPYFLY